MKKLFVVYACLFGLTAVYHAVGLFVRVNDASPMRHLVFVLVTGVMAYLMLKRPQFLPYLFAILLAQQLYSHGKDVYVIWTQQGQIDWLGLGVVLSMPVIFITILLDAKTRAR